MTHSPKMCEKVASSGTDTGGIKAYEVSKGMFALALYH